MKIDEDFCEIKEPYILQSHDVDIDLIKTLLSFYDSIVIILKNFKSYNSTCK